jgi:hydroxymethylglutaryl-CoA lyase
MRAENRRIDIVEVGPRDGLQSEPGVLPTAAKIEFIERAIAAGVRRVEVTSFVNPKRVPQMADAESVLAGLPRREGVHYIGLVLNRRGLERAIAAGCNEIGMAVVASDTFNRRNQGVSTDESIAAWLDIAAAARHAGIRAQVTVSAAFGCPFEGEVPPQRVVDIARRVAEAGPFEIALADTIGVGVPAQVLELVGRVREAVPGMALRCHFHNTRNTGLANAFAAVQAGVTTLDASRPPATSRPRTSCTCCSARATRRGSRWPRRSRRAGGCRSSSGAPCPACWSRPAIFRRSRRRRPEQHTPGAGASARPGVQSTDRQRQVTA